MKIRVLITNGGLGTDNQLVFRYDIHSWQGMKQVNYWTNYLAEKTGKDAWAEIWQEGSFEDSNKVIARVTL